MNSMDKTPVNSVYKKFTFVTYTSEGCMEIKNAKVVSK